MAVALVDAVIAFEERGDIPGALGYLLGQGLTPPDLDAMARILLGRERYLSAYGLSDRLIASGQDNLALRLVRGSVARIAGLEAQYLADLNHLRAAAPLDNCVLDELWEACWPVAPLLGLLRRGRTDAVVEIGKLHHALDRRLAPLYDEGLSPSVEESDDLPAVAAAMGQYRELAPRRVIVAGREHYFPSIPNSRPHEIGPRMVAGLGIGGWQAEFHPLRHPGDPEQLARDYADLADHCEAMGAEVVILDQPCLSAPGFGPLMDAVKGGGKRKVVGLYLDPWVRETWPEMALAGRTLDLLWGYAFPPGDDMAGKTFLAPFPIGLSSAPPPPAISGRATFVGGVEYYNWQRAIWLSALAEERAPVQVSISSHLTDNLPALASFRDYMERLSALGATLSFAMRSDFSRTMTGRMFETLYFGALLIQEECSDANRFLVPGRHYLSFRTRGDLRRIFARLRHAPEEVAAIRTAGTAFYHEHYSDRRITSSLDAALFCPREAGHSVA